MNIRQQVPEVPSGHLDLTRIGASDAPAILGVDKYRSALDVYLRLVGGPSEDDFPAYLREAANWGHRVEPLSAVALCESLGLDVERLAKGESRILKAREWARVSPDYLLTGDGDENGLIECKLISARRFDAEDWGEDGTDRVPARIKAQVLFQLEALKAEPEYWETQGLDAEALSGAHVAVCVGGQRLRRYWIPWNEALGNYLRSTCEALWFENVRERVPPAPDSSEAAAKALAQLANPSAPQRAATEEEAELLRSILEAKESIDAAKKLQTEAENKLKALLGYDSGGIVSGDLKASWVERKGSAQWSAIAKRVAEETGAQELLATLQAEMVGKPSRYLRTSLRRSKK